MSCSLLPLPLTPDQLLSQVIPAAMALLPQKMYAAGTAARRADVMMTTICLQETGLDSRRQGLSSSRPNGTPGPARGLAQFERNGVLGVMRFATTQQAARNAATGRGVSWDATAIHHAMEHDDVLCLAFTRLLLWTDRRPLPAVGAKAEALEYYLRNWRPGAANTERGLARLTARWQRNYPTAVAAVGRQ